MLGQGFFVFRMKVKKKQIGLKKKGIWVVGCDEKDVRPTEFEGIQEERGWRLLWEGEGVELAEKDWIWRGDDSRSHRQLRDASYR